MSIIVDFHKAEGLGIDLVGGKGLNLAIMTKSGINVPPGFIILSSVYEEFMSENKIDKFIEEQIDIINEQNIDSILKGIRESIVKANFSNNTELEIRAMFKTFSAPVHLAVRSSATAEDLEDASFAGQQETFLNVTSYENLLYSIKCCFASLWGRRAFEYRNIKKYSQSDISIAVVIQKMVNSDVSGVMFTSNPISGSEELVIDASYGLGEAIVSGKVSPDNYILDNNGNIKSYRLGSKNVQMIYSEDGIKEICTNEVEREERCLSDADLKILWEQSVEIKNIYDGVPIDIEWAKEKNNIYILQSRKITTIDNNRKSIGKLSKFGKKEKKYLNNMIEHFPVLWYPLDDDIAMILQNMKYDLLNEVGIYINNPLKMNDSGIIDIEKIRIKLGTKLLRYPFVYKEYTDDNKNIYFSTHELNRIEDQVNLIEKKICLHTEKDSVKNMVETIDDLIDLHKTISYVRFRYILFPSIILGEKLTKKIKKINKKYVEYDLLSDLDYITVSINKDLAKLSNQFKKNKHLMLDLKNGTNIEDIKQNYAQEYLLLKNFMDNYGWKSNYCCIPFSSESWNENPQRLIELILLNNDDFKNKKNVDSKYKSIIKEIDEYYKKNSKEFLKNIEFYRMYHVLRESSQYLWEKIFGLLRLSVKNICLKIGISYEDALYLRIHELKELLLKNESDKFLSVINNRKSRRNDAEDKWDNIIISAFSNENHDKFTGVGGSNGRVKGKVCIIKKHSEFSKLKNGDILVCPYTDPEWTPLFKLAKAVVADTGGALSHAAIVAREYGIPAVLGVGNATINLNDGDFIIVDGEQGTVEKII